MAGNTKYALKICITFILVLYFYFIYNPKYGKKILFICKYVLR